MPAPDVVDAEYEAAALEALLAAMEREPGRHIEVGLSAPLHEGAERYYKEKGLL